MRKLLIEQDDLITWRQLRDAGWSRRMIEDHAWRHGWRVLHQGVYAVSRGPLSRHQRWLAATLSAPNTYLGAASAGACYGFREWEGTYETVVRPGSGGPRRMGALLVARSTALKGQTTTHGGIPIVSAPLALIQLAPHLGKRHLGRGFRESIRLKTTTANEIARTLAGQRGTRVLAELCDRYATIPYHRCRSDAESRALEILHDAGITSPQVNVRVGGIEADLVWRKWRLIIEIDGGQFHLFSDEDARKEFAWRAAGYTVRRLSSDDVYHRPHRLLALVNVPDATT
jgi:very-short-patch-repair endonuclease